MAKLVFGMMQSLDGYVDHLELGPPLPAVARHFLAHMRNLTGCLYGRRMYEIMRYWDDDRNVENAEDRGGVAEPTEVGRVALVEGGRT